MLILLASHHRLPKCGIGGGGGKVAKVPGRCSVRVSGYYPGNHEKLLKLPGYSEQVIPHGSVGALRTPSTT